MDDYLSNNNSMLESQYPNKDDLLTTSKLVLLSGPSGSGKTTILTTLTDKYDIVPLVYYTTRSQREDDDTRLFQYISFRDYIDLFNSGQFIFSFGSHNNRYGVLFEEFNNNISLGKDMIITTSYNDYLSIIEPSVRNKVDIHLVILTFREIEKMVKERLLSRNPNMSPSNLDMKVRYALYENQNYFETISQFADNIIYTDESTIENTANVVCNSIYGEKELILKKRK